jgi:ferritin-like metal-binding protein YciE
MSDTREKDAPLTSLIGAAQRVEHYEIAAYTRPKPALQLGSR